MYPGWCTRGVYQEVYTHHGVPRVYTGRYIPTMVYPGVYIGVYPPWCTQGVYIGYTHHGVPRVYIGRYTHHGTHPGRLGRYIPPWYTPREAREAYTGCIGRLERLPGTSFNGETGEREAPGSL